MKNLDNAIPEIILELDNEERYKIKCSFGVFARFQKLTGQNPFEKDWGSCSPQDYICLIAACVYPGENDEPEKHLTEIGEKIGTMHLTQIRTLLATLFNRSAKPVLENGAIPETEEEKKIENPVIG